MPQHADLAAPDIDSRLYDAARRLAGTFSAGLPVHELRPALHYDLSQLCASIVQVDDVALREPLAFKSLRAVTLQSVVQAGIGLSLPLDRLLDGANVEELTEVLLCGAAG